MTYSSSISPDFTSIAQDLTASWSLKPVSGGSALIPAEAHSRMRREGDRFLASPSLKGATVDQEGLTNNYAVEPDMYYAVFPAPEQARRYALQGLGAVAFVVSLVLTSAAI